MSIREDDHLCENKWIKKSIHLKITILRLYRSNPVWNKKDKIHPKNSRDYCIKVAFTNCNKAEIKYNYQKINNK